jgi:hypothetical protein
MDVGSEELFRNKLDATNFELSSKTKVSQKGRPFTLKEKIMYTVGQDNKTCKCLTQHDTHLTS